jgi:hypothetical protein
MINTLFNYIFDVNRFQSSRNIETWTLYVSKDCLYEIRKDAESLSCLRFNSNDELDSIFGIRLKVSSELKGIDYELK